MSIKQHIRRLGEGTGIVVVLYALYGLAKIVFEQNVTLLYILAFIATVVACYFVGAIIED